MNRRGARYISPHGLLATIIRVVVFPSRFRYTRLIRSHFGHQNRFILYSVCACFFFFSFYSIFFALRRLLSTLFLLLLLLLFRFFFAVNFSFVSRSSWAVIVARHVVKYSVSEFKYDSVTLLSASGAIRAAHSCPCRARLLSLSCTFFVASLLYYLYYFSFAFHQFGAFPAD